MIVTILFTSFIVFLAFWFSKHGFDLNPDSHSKTDAPQETAAPVIVLDPSVVHKEAVFTTDEDKRASADQIKEFLEENTDSEYLVSAIMGMMYRESRFFSYRVAHQRGNSMEFTKKIDEGLADGSTKDYFIDYTTYSSGGYGLCMFSGAYLPDLYDFAQEWGTSIGDAEMQCAFVVKDIKENHSVLYDSIINAKSAYEAGFQIARSYEGTAATDAVAGNSEYYYKLYYSGS